MPIVLAGRRPVFFVFARGRKRGLSPWRGTSSPFAWDFREYLWQFFLLHRISNWHFKDVPTTRVGLYTGYLRAGGGILRAVSPLCSLHNVTLSPFVTTQPWSVFNAKPSMLAALHYFFMNHSSRYEHLRGRNFKVVFHFCSRVWATLVNSQTFFNLSRILGDYRNVLVNKLASDSFSNTLAHVRCHSCSLIFIVPHLQKCSKPNACHGLGKFM